ncbi:MAG: DUF4957 domain-containing protein [Marinilabiliaceae bacterium]|nr:DUF4957 domain-containing protein [Marinilabiliaceae bacterium]
MKQTFTFLLAMFLTSLTFSKAEEIQVATGGDIASAISGASAGDAIVLEDGGTYTISSSIIIDKTIIIKATDGATIKPKINVTASTAFKTSSTGAGLTLIGLNIEGPQESSYFIVTAEGDVIDHIRFYDSEIHHFGRCAIRSSNDLTTLREVVVENCFIHDFTSSTWRLFWLRHSNTDRIIMKNSTFAKFTESVLFKEGNDNGADTIIISNCTVSDKIGADKNGVFHVIAETVTSSFSVSNSIITNIESDTATFVMSPNVADTIKNSRYYGIAATAVPVNIWNNETNYSEADPQYTNSVNNDYTIGNESFKTASTTGSIIGDPRWYNILNGMKDNKIKTYDITFANNVITSPNETVIIEIYSISGRMVKKALNTNNVDVTDLNNGIYIVKAKNTNGKSLVAKFVK